MITGELNLRLGPSRKGLGEDFIDRCSVGTDCSAPLAPAGECEGCVEKVY